MEEKYINLIRTLALISERKPLFFLNNEQIKHLVNTGLNEKINNVLWENMFEIDKGESVESKFENVNFWLDEYINGIVDSSEFEMLKN